MGCSNTKAIPNGAGETLSNTMNVLNSIDPSKVIDEGEKMLNQGKEKVLDEGDKLLNQAQEIIEKSAAALENVISGNGSEESSEESSENLPLDDSKADEVIEIEEKTEEEETKSSETEQPSVILPEETDFEPVEATTEVTPAESDDKIESSKESEPVVESSEDKAENADDNESIEQTVTEVGSAVTEATDNSDK